MLYNLREYHQPTELEEALTLIQRTDLHTAVLAGGTQLIGQPNPNIEAVVDLSALQLDGIERSGKTLRLGAMLRLQTIVEELPEEAGGLLALTAYRMAGWHIRNMATLGGLLGGQDIHSPLSVALNVLDAKVVLWGDEGEKILRWPFLFSLDEKRLITAVIIDLPAGETGTAYAQVARTDADQPIVSAAAIATRKDEGRITARTVVGGLMDDGLALVDLDLQGDAPDLSAIDRVAIELEDAPLISNPLGSAEYRRSVAPVLARRALMDALGNLNINIEG